MTNQPWNQAANETANKSKTDVYLNIEIEVEKGVFIRMPLNCPVSNDLTGMSKQQKMLMAALIRKAEAAMEIEDEEARNEALVLRPNIKATLFKRVELTEDELGNSGLDSIL